MSRARAFWVIAHRWAGLTIALFLIVAGSTGALLAFYEELYDATAEWRVVEVPYEGAKPLDALALNEAAAKHAPVGYTIGGLRLNVEPHRVLEVSLDPKDPETMPYLEAAINPYTGELVKLYEWGAISQGFHQIMPFIYQLHYKLALGDIGLWAFGIAALIWTIDCFVGFYLTLPRVSFRGWGKAWRVRWKASNYKVNFDLHRAGGLWLWPVLLVFAWSSVAMNLREVYDPVMKALGSENRAELIPANPAPAGYRPDYAKALADARRLSAEAVTATGATVTSEGYLYFDAEKNVYDYSFATDQDFTSKGNWSLLVFSPSGALTQLTLADGGLDQGGADDWFFTLHMAQVGGLPYRIFVSALGLLITMLSVTGVVIWMRKRSARIAHGQKRKSNPAAEPILAPAE
jgi:uncharacterized iron-regulated membrane protein